MQGCRKAFAQCIIWPAGNANGSMRHCTCSSPTRHHSYTAFVRTMSKFALRTSSTAMYSHKHMPEGNCARKSAGAYQLSQCGSAAQELPGIRRVLTNAQKIGKAAELQDDKCKTLCTGVSTCALLDALFVRGPAMHRSKAPINFCLRKGRRLA